MTHDDATKHTAQTIRAAINEAEPALGLFLDDCKRVFGARLRALDCGDIRVGRIDDPWYHGFIPAAPPKGATGNKEARDSLREAEASHIAQAVEARDRAVGSTRRYTGRPKAR